MTGPNAVELQRALAETTRCLKQLTVERYETRYGDKEPKGCCYDAVDAAEKLLADLPPAPEPIKVGDRVRGSYPDWDHIVGVVQHLTAGGNAVVDDRFAGEVLVAVSELGVMSPSDPDYPSPSPESEPDDDWLYCPDCGCAACSHGATGCRYHDGPDGCKRTSPGVDPAPSPSPEVGEGAEPHESDDPEELAAAVAAGLTVEWWSAGDGRWLGTNAKTAGQFRPVLHGYRIWGTVPGYGETAEPRESEDGEILRTFSVDYLVDRKRDRVDEAGSFSRFDELVEAVDPILARFGCSVQGHSDCPAGGAS